MDICLGEGTTRLLSIGVFNDYGMAMGVIWEWELNRRDLGPRRCIITRVFSTETDGFVVRQKRNETQK